MRSALTVAGFDPCGGAGIQADLKVFHRLKVHGLSVVTAVTVQNTRGVEEVEGMRPDIFSKQLDCLLLDISPHAVKTGMLYSGELLEALKESVLRYGLTNIVIDPVLVSSSGTRLLDDQGVHGLVEKLFPLATVVTPNIPEAELLCGMAITTEEEVHKALKKLLAMGPKSVVLKGGHFSHTESAVDFFYDGKDVMKLHSPFRAGDYHGTGCTFSAALAGHLALGREIRRAVHLSKTLVSRAIEKAFKLGSGMSILHV